MQDSWPEAEHRRCAIYTRKSVDQGLELEFNSLETQRAICSAYVTSQRHKGWHELPTHYDDGGRSGATLDRPELQHLLADIESGVIDVVVVYKLDRITRTLLDFVRLMDFFQRYGVAFVSITQSFDTSDSMGRLILNVLLTFAQFEREILSDRIRDKQRVIRESGRWAVGAPPIGYSVENRILQVNEREAETVRFVFERFAELNNYTAVGKECMQRGLRGRCWITAKGRRFGDRPVSCGTVYKILSNPVYVGLIKSGQDLIQGLHRPIIDQALWDRVQVLRGEHSLETLAKKRRQNLLSGLLFDCHGRPMGAHHYRSTTGGFYGYYVSYQNGWGARHQLRALRARVDALDDLVRATLGQLFCDHELVRSGLMLLGHFGPDLDRLAAQAPVAARRLATIKPGYFKNVLHSVFARIELSNDRLQAIVRWDEVERYLSWDGVGLYQRTKPGDRRSEKTYLLDVPCSSARCRRALVMPIEPRPATARRAPDRRLVRLVQEARRAQALVDEHRDLKVADIASKMRLSEWRFARLLHLNYLAPDIMTGLLDGTQPAGITRKKLLTANLPLDWALQRQILGYPPKASADGY